MNGSPVGERPYGRWGAVRSLSGSGLFIGGGAWVLFWAALTPNTYDHPVSMWWLAFVLAPYILWAVVYAFGWYASGKEMRRRNREWNREYRKRRKENRRLDIAP